MFSVEGTFYGRHSSPQLRTGRVLVGEMPHDASGTGLADLERLMVGQPLPGGHDRIVARPPRILACSATCRSLAAS
jgi:hypothetical protein